MVCGDESFLSIMKPQRLTIRECDPSTERSRILAVLERNLPEASGSQRFDWLYLSNPAGNARVWLAENQDGETVGTSAGHPRLMRVRDQVVTVLNLSDFAIDANYRSLGPALQLLRATLAPMDEGRYAFSYDHPSAAMLAVYRRMGGTSLGSLVRYVRPLTASSVVERRWGPGTASKVVGAAGDLALRARDATLRKAGDIEVTLHEGEFTREFDDLAERLYAVCPVVGLRTAAFLNWRFARHPLRCHETLCARRGGQLLGCLIFRTAASKVISVVELIGGLDEDIVRALLVKLIALARSRGVERLQAPVLENCPVAAMLENSGFHERQRGPGPVVYAPPASAVADTVKRSKLWWMVEGDRDV